MYQPITKDLDCTIFYTYSNRTLATPVLLVVRLFYWHLSLEMLEIDF